MSEAANEELTAFCRTEYPRLVGVLTLYCGSRPVAEELAQEALARAWHRWARVRHFDRPEAWVRRVALNLANSHLRRVLAERRALARLAEPSPVVEPSDRSLIDAVGRLPRRQRVVVILHYYLDLPLDEVALQLETTVPTVKSLLHRALKHLRSQADTNELLEAPDVT